MKSTILCFALILSLKAFAADSTSVINQGVLLPATHTILTRGLTEDQMKTLLVGDSVEFHSMMGMGMGLADIHSSAGNYKLMLSTSDHKLAGFSVIGADTVSPINNDSLQSWFDSNVKALPDAKHSAGKGIKDLPYEAWSTDDIEWRQQTVQNKTKTKTHTIYMITFGPDKK